jgi:hypothetical protein
MLFTFSKEIKQFVQVEGYGVLAQCRFYQVFSDGRKIGQYFGHHDVSFFAFEGYDIRIEHDGFMDKNPKTRFVNQVTGEVIGKYGRWTAHRKRFTDVFGWLWLGEMVYEAIEVAPDQKGRFQVQVGRPDEQVVFMFGFDRELGVRDIDRPIRSGHRVAEQWEPAAVVWRVVYAGRVL